MLSKTTAPIIFPIVQPSFYGYYHRVPSEELRMLHPVIRRYWQQYKWSNVFEMIKNMKKEPKQCEQPFRGKLVVITGATSGIGYHAVRKYASMGHASS